MQSGERSGYADPVEVVKDDIRTLLRKLDGKE